MPLDARSVAADWLASLSSAISAADVEAVTGHFLPDGWLRDVLVFTWDVRAIEGRDRIASYLADTMSPAHITEVRLNDTTDLVPRTVAIPTLKDSGVELAFTFECRHGHGRAHARLLRDPDGNFKALSLFTELSDLAGHEEAGTLPLRDDVTGVPGRDMQREFKEWVEEVERKPYALIG